jgi:hypothetical protein
VRKTRQLASLWRIEPTSRLSLQLVAAGDHVRLAKTYMAWFWVHSKDFLGVAAGGSASKEEAVAQVEAYLLSKLSAHQKLDVLARAAKLP